MPTEVVPGFLFVGSFDHASRADLMKTLGITHVVNVGITFTRGYFNPIKPKFTHLLFHRSFFLQTVATCPCLYKNSFIYHKTPEDGCPPSFQECSAFIDSVRIAGAKVLVHCMSGNSRSPSIILYYMMSAYKQKLDQAYDYLKSKRPSLAFNEKDAGRLEEAEVQIFGPEASRFKLPVGKQLSSLAGGGGGGGGDGMIGWNGAGAQQQQQQMLAMDSRVLSGGGNAAPRRMEFHDNSSSGQSRFVFRD